MRGRGSGMHLERLVEERLRNTSETARYLRVHGESILQLVAPRLAGFVQCLGPLRRPIARRSPIGQEEGRKGARQRRQLSLLGQAYLRSRALDCIAHHVRQRLAQPALRQTAHERQRPHCGAGHEHLPLGAQVVLDDLQWVERLWLWRRRRHGILVLVLILVFILVLILVSAPPLIAGGWSGIFRCFRLFRPCSLTRGHGLVLDYFGHHDGVNGGLDGFHVAIPFFERL
mmetsp:Transcript_15101/g.31673  ORF Transcript_15101/g.31673 Transcript_15101/m.31673 type:complete len:229 (-) Transcript_15101:1514-2200(-)